MYILNEQEEGLYNLYFHSCPNYQRNLFALNFEVSFSSSKGNMNSLKYCDFVNDFSIDWYRRGKQKQFPIGWRDAFTRALFHDVTDLFFVGLILVIPIEKEHVSVYSTRYSARVICI